MEDEGVCRACDPTDWEQFRPVMFVGLGLPVVACVVCWRQSRTQRHRVYITSKAEALPNDETTVLAMREDDGDESPSTRADESSGIGYG